MNEQLQVQTTLRKKLLEYQSKNSSFSVRALAKKLNLQPSATNEILKGERKVSVKLAEKIALRLQLDPTERAALLTAFPKTLPSRKKSEQSDNVVSALKLSSEQFALISEWIHFALLSFMKTKGFKEDHKYLAQKFSVSESTIKKALERMISISLIHRTPSGKLKRTSSKINTTDDVKDLSLQKAHMADMEMAKDKIQQLQVTQRDFSFLIFNGNPKYLPKAKEVLRKAQDDLEALMDQDDACEVYKVCTYLFPLTNATENKRRE
jgi:uncharacterized protein (TIGR02147 family)